MRVEIEGFDEPAGEPDRPAEDVAAIDGANAVPFDELFPPDSVRTCTGADSMASSLEASPWDVGSKADFEAIPEAAFDACVHEHAGFNSREAVLSAAAGEWVGRQLHA